jgi:hypothetical protein
MVTPGLRSAGVATRYEQRDGSSEFFGGRVATFFCQRCGRNTVSDASIFSDGITCVARPAISSVAELFHFEN